jgi:hypothetical protein
MAWQDDISLCFGSDEFEFGARVDQRRRAARMLTAALEADVGCSEYLAQIRTWLRRTDLSEAYIARQLRRARDLSNYFARS